MKVGFIGTGTMGQPMLANLVKKGFRAIAYDTAPAALDAAVRLGAERAGSAAETAAAAAVVITMLPSSANVETVYLGVGGLLEAAPRGRLCVDMSTIDPGISQQVAARLQERGLRFLDAPAGWVVRRPGHWRSWSAAKLPILKRRTRYWRPWVRASFMSALSAPARSPSCATI
jgi:3-hydroxyisobutyrate dehydrogenase-like beta-hydroxyacid dehydrogenase